MEAQGQLCGKVRPETLGGGGRLARAGQAVDERYGEAGCNRTAGGGVKASPSFTEKNPKEEEAREGNGRDGG
jgi:hypothetical protein